MMFYVSFKFFHIFHVFDIIPVKKRKNMIVEKLSKYMYSI